MSAVPFYLFSLRYHKTLSRLVTVSKVKLTFWGPVLCWMDYRQNPFKPGNHVF